MSSGIITRTLNTRASAMWFSHTKETVPFVTRRYQLPVYNTYTYTIDIACTLWSSTRRGGKFFSLVSCKVTWGAAAFERAGHIATGDPESTGGGVAALVYVCEKKWRMIRSRGGPFLASTLEFKGRNSEGQKGRCMWCGDADPTFHFHANPDPNLDPTQI